MSSQQVLDVDSLSWCRHCWSLIAVL